MKRVIVAAGLAGVLVPVVGTVVGGRAAVGAAPAHPSPVERGGYLVQMGGCNHCHTPWAFNKDLGMPVPDMTRMLSGHPAGAPDPGGTVGAKDIGLIGPTFTSFKMPFGTVYAPNLTPDTETGLGSWTEAMFVKALRTGKHMGGDGRAILPPMPWMDLARGTDDDLKAIFAFLRSIPAVKNPVPDHKVPPPAMDGITQSMAKLGQMMQAQAQAEPAHAKPKPEKRP
jgi:hypothetical protein